LTADDNHVLAFRRYQQTRGLARATIERRNVSLQGFATSIAPLPLLQAEPDLIEDWLGTFASPATRRAYRSDLMAYYTWAAKRGLSSNPVLAVDGIRVPKTLPRPVPASHLQAVLKSAPRDVRVMIALAAFAGLRRAEIAALDAADVDLLSEPPTLAVRAGKGNKDRIIPVHPDLASVLATAPRHGPVVGVTASTVGHRVADHLRKVGIEATAHQLRHTFGTELARATDGNVILIATLMGHADISTSMGYIGWAGGPSVDAVAAMYPHAASCDGTRAA
jgi:integrase/recombinase XerD